MNPSKILQLKSTVASGWRPDRWVFVTLAFCCTAQWLQQLCTWPPAGLYSCTLVHLYTCWHTCTLENLDTPTAKCLWHSCTVVRLNNYNNCTLVHLRVCTKKTLLCHLLIRCKGWTCFQLDPDSDSGQKWATLGSNRPYPYPFCKHCKSFWWHCTIG